ncbi:MAG: cytochrome P450 [Chloroflexota bacterium]
MSKLPFADAQTGLQVLRALVKQRSLLAALETMHAEVGDIFHVTLPRFDPAFVVGPEANRQLLVTGRDQFNWRTESDAVTKLLGHGLLVEDGDSHACLRHQLEPALGKRQVAGQIGQMVAETDRVLASWPADGQRDMLVEMRKVALLILMQTLFGVDFLPHLERLWQPILQLLRYISPGLWIIWPNMPRPGYARAQQAVDDYLFGIIRERRAAGGTGDDMLSRLVRQPEMSDKLIRDQLLTIMIAGHDTSTALLAWVWHLLGSHPAAMAQAVAEVEAVVGQDMAGITAVSLPQLTYLDQVIKETLRLYPPIHVGNRLTNSPVTMQGYDIPAGMRVMYSIYLAHRHPDYWDEPELFRPERFGRSAEPENGYPVGKKRPSFIYLPFGGGPRNCIGAAFAQIEAKVVLARILQRFQLVHLPQEVHPHMGATLEPRPGVFMRVISRQ